MEARALLLRVPNNLLRPWNLAIKRAFDLAVGSALALAVLPLIAVLAVAVAIDSPGPGLYVEPRIGRRRGPFACFKLRTLLPGADPLLQAEPEGPPRAA